MRAYLSSKDKNGISYLAFDGPSDEIKEELVNSKIFKLHPDGIYWYSPLGEKSAKVFKKIVDKYDIQIDKMTDDVVWFYTAPRTQVIDTFFKKIQAYEDALKESNDSLIKLLKVIPKPKSSNFLN